MDTSVKVFAFLSAVFIIFGVVSAQNNATRAYGHVGTKTNVSTVGICEIEVP